MPFTTVSKVSLDKGSGGPVKGYFHPQDISIVMNQPGAEVVVCVNAIISNVETKVLLAAQIGQDGWENRFDDPEQLAALLCPPHTEQGGIFNPNP